MIRETLLHAKGPGGLAVWLAPKPRLTEKLALLAVDYGSNDLVIPTGKGSRPTLPGIAHFLEHTLFETAKGNASDLFSTRGAYSNAFTDNTGTGYLFSAPDRWKENLDLLLDFVFHPPFPPAKVEKERGIILQELRMYRDSPSSRLSENLGRALYRKHPVRVDVGGTLASVRAIRRDDLVACHDAFYAPSNTCLVAVGALRMDDLLDIASRRVPARRRPRPPHVLPREPAAVCRRRTSARLDVAQPQLLLGFKDPHPPAEGPAMLRRRIAVGLCLSLMFDRAASLYGTLYDAGLIDEDFGGGYTAERGFAYAAVGGKTRDPEGLSRRLLKGMAEARRRGFRAEDLARAKRKSLGGFIRLFDHPQALAPAMAAAHFLGLPLLDYPKYLEACGMDAVRAALDGPLAEEGHAVSIVWPR